MKSYILLILISGILFGNQLKGTTADRDLTKKLNSKTVVSGTTSTSKKGEIDLGKNPHCSTAVGRQQFYGINDKGEYRADIKFKYCLFNNQKYENVIVGIIVTDINALIDYTKKYTYLHLKEGTKITQASDKTTYQYNNSWAWSSSSAYPASIFNKLRR